MLNDFIKMLRHAGGLTPNPFSVHELRACNVAYPPLATSIDLLAHIDVQGLSTLQESSMPEHSVDSA